jgi:hypothetical protein
MNVNQGKGAAIVRSAFPETQKITVVDLDTAMKVSLSLFSLHKSQFDSNVVIVVNVIVVVVVVVVVVVDFLHRLRNC